MDLKRDIVKYIRDKAKNKYEKGSECYICGSDVKLDFHHFYTLSPLVHKYVKDKKLLPENILSFREDFIQDHWAELYEHTVTLCHDHHLALHKIYGRNPSLATATKQKNWVEIQREKHGMVG
tara:strand:+ start:440 stop:805 length:366 start_codon:yes stop_codon:yes gene_type:complete